MDFSRTSELLTGAHFSSDLSGSQLYVSRFADPLFESAVGAVHDGRPLGVDTSIMWVCCSKSTLLFPLARVLDENGIDESAPVADVVPEYAAGGKETVTIAHLLTHTVPYEKVGMIWDEDQGGISRDETPLMLLPWEEAIAAVCEEQISTAPGESVTYTAVANWFVLAEVVERLSGESFPGIVDREVFEPLGMSSSTAVLTPENADRWRRDHATLRFYAKDGSSRLTGTDDPPLVYRSWPGVGVRGPAREMARPIEAVAGWTGAGLLSESWRRKLVEPYRLDLPDPVYQGAEMMWSLGLCVDPVPFGVELDRRVVGLTGAGSSLVFADLDTGLTVSFISSSVLPRLADWARKKALVQAVRADVADLRSTL